jgi:hypothetical protein
MSCKYWHTHEVDYDYCELHNDYLYVDRYSENPYCRCNDCEDYIEYTEEELNELHKQWEDRPIILKYPCQKAALETLCEGYHPTHNPPNWYYCDCECGKYGQSFYLKDKWDYINKEKELKEANKRMSKIILKQCEENCKYINL